MSPAWILVCPALQRYAHHLPGCMHHVGSKSWPARPVEDIPKTLELHVVDPRSSSALCGVDTLDVVLHLMRRRTTAGCGHLLTTRSGSALERRMTSHLGSSGSVGRKLRKIRGSLSAAELLEADQPEDLALVSRNATRIVLPLLLLCSSKVKASAVVPFLAVFLLDAFLVAVIWCSSAKAANRSGGIQNLRPVITARHVDKNDR